MQLTQQRSKILKFTKRFVDTKINWYAPQRQKAEMFSISKMFKKISHLGLQDLLGLAITEALVMVERKYK